MYNRYVPKPDGSFRRDRMQERLPPEDPVCNTPPPPPPYTPPSGHHGHGAGFLKKLLGQDFDTGDLIVMLLLLLMAGDREEDRNTALLTLALYFIM